jgi:hypothetical protein
MRAAADPPIIGLIDPHGCAPAHRAAPARDPGESPQWSVVIDITGVAAMDANVANHLVLTVNPHAAVCHVIRHGLSREIARPWSISAWTGKMNTVGDCGKASKRPNA